MRPIWFTLALSLSLAAPSQALIHGGTYRGPSDTVPPSGGGGSGGGGSPTPGPGQPGNTPPGPGRTGGANTPGQPGGGGGPGNPARTGGEVEPDLSSWQYWWGFNKEPFLNLRAHLDSLGVATGSDEDWLGRGQRDQVRNVLRVSEETIRNKVVPLLLEALESERSNDIRSSAMVALARIGDLRDENGRSRFADAIAKFLDDPNQELSETAAVSLGILADTGQLPRLIALARGERAGLAGSGAVGGGEVPLRTRAFAAYGLGLIGCTADEAARREINGAMRKLLDGEGKRMAQRDLQVACLTTIGLTPLAPDASGGELPAEDLRSLEDQIAYLLAYHADESNPALVRAHAPTAMMRLLSDGAAGESGSPAVNPLLRERVARALLASLPKTSRATNELRQSAVQALGRIADADGDPLDVEIRTALMAMSRDAIDQQARHFAYIALAQCGSRAGTGAGDPLEAVNTKDRERNVRSFLTSSLARGTGQIPSWSALSLAILERQLDERHRAGSSDAKQALASALAGAGNPSDRGAMAIACGLVRDVGALDRLLSNLAKLRDVEARGATAIGVGLLGDRSAIEPVQQLVRSSRYQPDLLKNAAIALGLLGDRNAVSLLVEMLDKSEALSSQAALSTALGFIGDTRSIDPLIELAQRDSATDMARAFAVVALGLICDKEPLPWNAKIGVDSNYRANTPSLTNQKSGILDIL